MNRPGLVIPILALAALFLGWRVYDAWTAPAGRPVSPASPPAASPAVASPGGMTTPADLTGAVLAIAARPLFRPDRKPFMEDPAAAPLRRNYQAELARFTLLGVLLHGPERTGIVVGKGAGGREERWEVVPGDELPGFTVTDVEVDGLTLAADNQSFQLPLYAGAPKGQAGAVPPRTETPPPRQVAPAPQAPAPPQPGGTAGQPAVGVPAPPAAAVPSTAPQPDRGRGRPYRQRYVPGRR